MSFFTNEKRWRMVALAKACEPLPACLAVGRLLSRASTQKYRQALPNRARAM
jgi:hypothetical protein